MSAFRMLQWPPVTAGWCPGMSHQVKRFHIVEGLRVPLQVVRFLIVLHVAGCWLSDLTHLLETKQIPSQSRTVPVMPLSSFSCTGVAANTSCKCPHSDHNMWPGPPSWGTELS